MRTGIRGLEWQIEHTPIKQQGIGWHAESNWSSKDAIALVTSLLMGVMHYFNPAGHGLGPVAATTYCLVTCLILRRTGDLWMPLGIHLGWDWARVTSTASTGQAYYLGLPSHEYCQAIWTF